MDRRLFGCLAGVATDFVASLRTKEYDVFRELLRERRESRGFSQEALSLKMGRTISFMGKVEGGTRRLDIIELHQICAALEEDLVKFVAALVERLNEPKGRRSSD